MNILAIGNSFSQDATGYLAKIARTDGFDMTVVNLYIGGCSLKRHYSNIDNDAKEYVLEYNGENTGFFVSVKEALQNRVWDYITLQQVSHESIDYETYQPYLNKIVEFIRKESPASKIVLHQTWAYEQGSNRLCEELKYRDQSEMYEDIKSAYNKAFREIDACMMIPSGEMFQKLIEKGIPVHRDTFHASLGIGRYALGLLWYVKLTGRSISANTFCEFDEPIPEDTVQQIKQIVDGFAQHE